MRAIAVLFCLLTVACGDNSTQAKVPANLRVRSLELIDSKDRIRARLEMVADSSGKAPQPSFLLYDEKMRHRIAVRITSSGNPYVAIYRVNNKKAAIMTVSKGEPAVEIFDAKGKIRLAVSMPANGGPGVRLYDAKGKTRLAVSMVLDRSPGVGLYDAKGKIRLAVSMPANGGPGVVLFDTKTKARVVIGIDGTGKGVVTDGTGKGVVLKRLKQ
jgi:hypothetical protein